MLKSVVAGLYVRICKPTNLSSKVTYHFASLPARYENSCCSTSLSAFGLVSHSTDVVSFPCWHVLWSIFSYVYLPLAYFWWSVRSWPISKVEFQEFFVCFWLLVLYQMCLMQMLSQSVVYFLISWFCLKMKVLNFNEMQLVNNFFMDFIFAVIVKKVLPYPRSPGFSPMISSRSFIVLYFTFRPMIYSELIFVKVVRVLCGFNFIFLLWKNAESKLFFPLISHLHI